MQNQQDFEKLFRQELESVPFPVADISLLGLFVINNFSCARMSCDLETFKSIAESNEEGNFNLYNVSFVLNGVSSSSAKDLQVNVSEYIQIQERIKELSDEWNSIVAPIRTKLMNKLQTQNALEVPKNGKSVIPPQIGRR